MQLYPLFHGDTFKETMFGLIDQAQNGDDLWLNYFVIRGDAVGTTLMAKLVAAARRGVKVTLIVDSYGTFADSGEGTEYSGRPLSKLWTVLLQSFGGDVFEYNRVRHTKFYHLSNLSNWRNFSRRNHNKVFIFNLKSRRQRGVATGDSQWAIEHFNGQMRGHNVLVLSDKVYFEALTYHKMLTRRIGDDRLNDYVLNEKDEVKLLERVEAQGITPLCLDRIPSFSCSHLRFVFSDIEFDNPKHRHTIQHYEMSLLSQVKRRFQYCTPYFGPDEELISVLKRARKTVGTHGKVMVAKFRHDPYLPYGMEKAAKPFKKFRQFLFEYKGLGNIHYKDMLVDDVVFIKSSNGEGRSRFYNLESGIIIHSSEFSQYYLEYFRSEMQNYRPLCFKKNFHSHHHLLERISKVILRPLYYHHL